MRTLSLVALLLIPLSAAAEYPAAAGTGAFITSTAESNGFYVSNEPPLKAREWPVDPPRVLGCRRTEQISTVPSADGGERQIRITRC